MRSILGLLACAFLIAAVTAGCGRKQTIETPEGKVTIEERAGKAEVTIEGEEGEGKVEIKGDEVSGKITTEEGTVELGTEAEVSEQELGIPIYPGAKPEQTGRLTQTGEEPGEFVQATFTTRDSIDKVKAFYQEKFPKSRAAMDIRSADSRMVQMVLEEDETQKTVMISRDKDEKRTNIVLMRVEKETGEESGGGA